MSRDVAYRNGYLPLYAGAELIRRSGSLTQFPADNLIGTLPPVIPPTCAVRGSNTLTISGDGTSLLDPSNIVSYFPSLGNIGWETNNNVFTQAPRVIYNGPANPKIAPPGPHGFGNGGWAFNRNGLYLPNDPAGCRFFGNIEGLLLVDGPGVQSQTFVSFHMGTDVSTGADPTNGFQMDFTAAAAGISASFFVARTGSTSATSGWVPVPLVAGSALTMLVTMTPGNPGSTTVRFDYQHIPGLEITVPLAPIMGGATSQRIIQWNSGANTAPLQVVLNSITTNYGT